MGPSQKTSLTDSWCSFGSSWYKGTWVEGQQQNGFNLVSWGLYTSLKTNAFPLKIDGWKRNSRNVFLCLFGTRGVHISNWKSGSCSWGTLWPGEIEGRLEQILVHWTHGTGNLYLYQSQINYINIGEYTIYMDPPGRGHWVVSSNTQAKKISPVMSWKKWAIKKQIWN